jgi:hypothetical protein
MIYIIFPIGFPLFPLGISSFPLHSIPPPENFLLPAPFYTRKKARGDKREKERTRW